MPLVLFKLRCGVIYTDTFAAYVQRVHADQAAEHPGQVLTLDYIRSAHGPEHGRAWWHIHWLPEEVAPSYRRFAMGEVTVHLPKSAQDGLRERCLDYADGGVIVRP